ncbi:MAG: hypothetical protein WBB24_13560 [Maribacter sp.]
MMYSDRTDSELVDILGQESLLTFEAQLNLQQELKRRAIAADTASLDQSIFKKMQEIKNLDYLKDFGFKAERIANGIVVTRTKKAIWTDVIGVILGLIVFFIGLNGIINLVFAFINGDELDVFTLAFKFAVASLVFIGFSFFSGLKRLFDYSGFELSNTQGLITLKKRFDVKIEQIQAKASDLFLDTDEDNLQLKLGKEIIFTSNADSLVQTMTLEELAKELKDQ